MNNNDIVAAIMAKLRELHPELPERACVKLELDLRRRRRLRQKMRVAKLDQANLARVTNSKKRAIAIGNNHTSDADAANGPIAER